MAGETPELLAVDGEQQIADQIKRGLCRALAALGLASLTEFSLSN